MLVLIRSPLVKASLLCALSAAICMDARLVSAQDPPPPIPRFVIDVHGVVPMFPSSQTLADSRGLGTFGLSELPGAGFGGDIAVHLYPFKWRAVTFGVGGRAMASRASKEPETVAGQPTALVAVTEKFTYIGPEISLNFGTGAGWSYLSAGMNASTWSIIPKCGPSSPTCPTAPEGTDSPPLPPDQQRLKTITYGGGARWFAKPHLAFSFDVRVYAINPSTPDGPLPVSPRTTLLVIGAGISIK